MDYWSYAMFQLLQTLHVLGGIRVRRNRYSPAVFWAWVENQAVVSVSRFVSLEPYSVITVELVIAHVFLAIFDPQIVIIQNRYIYNHIQNYLNVFALPWLRI